MLRNRFHLISFITDIASQLLIDMLATQSFYYQQLSSQLLLFDLKIQYYIQNLEGRDIHVTTMQVANVLDRSAAIKLASYIYCQINKNSYLFYVYLFLESAAADVLIYLMINLEPRITFPNVGCVFSIILISPLLVLGKKFMKILDSTWSKNKARIPKKYHCPIFGH